MSSNQLQRHSLYVLIALTLLLQSFAVWHEVEHPYHEHVSQCDRFQAVSQLPLADLSADLQVHHQYLVFNDEKALKQITLALVDRYQRPIRAPPQFS